MGIVVGEIINQVRVSRAGDVFHGPRLAAAFGPYTAASIGPVEGSTVQNAEVAVV